MAFLSFPSPTQLKNISLPADVTDAATKGYVDDSLAGGTATISVGNVAAAGNIVATGNVSGGNITSAGTVVATSADLGNSVVANYFAGNGALLTNITASNITGTVSTANYAAYAGNITLAAQSNITSVGTLTSLNVTGNVSFTGANVNLGSVSNLHISGGSFGYFLKTDGAGNVSWAAQGSTTPELLGEVDEFIGDGTQTNFTLSVTPSSKNVTFVVVQGIMQPKNSYSVSGSILTFSTAPPNTAFVEVTIMRLG